MFDKYGLAVLNEPAQDYADYLTLCGFRCFAEGRTLCLYSAAQHVAASALLSEVYEYDNS